MKNLTIAMLVVMIPFLTTAQKRSNNSKSVTTDAAYKFMIITGHTINSMPAKNINSTNDVKKHVKGVKVSFDFGGEAPDEQFSESKYKSMAHVVNVAALHGWEFLDANVVNSGQKTTHYYYMAKRRK